MNVVSFITKMETLTSPLTFNMIKNEQTQLSYIFKKSSTLSSTNDEHNVHHLQKLEFCHEGDT